MKKYIPFLVLSFILLSCNERYKTEVHVSEVIPENYNSVLKINSLNDFRALSTGNIPFNELQQESYNKIDFLKTDSPIYICIVDSSAFFVTKHLDSTNQNDSIQSLIIGSKKRNFLLHKEDTIYKKLVDGYHLYTTNYNLNETKRAKNPELKKLISTSASEEIATLIFRNKATNGLLLRNKDSIFNNTHDLIDVKSNGNNITFSGISKSIDSLSYINVFKNTSPQKFELATIIPSNTNSVTRLAFDDYSIFTQNLSTISGRHTDSISDILTIQNEIALIENNKDKAIVMHALDAELLREQFLSFESNESFRGIPIFKMQEKDLFKHALSPFLSLDEISFGFIYESFSVFANDIKTLEAIISSKLNNQTLSTLDKFKSLNEELAAESSLLYYKDGEGLYNFLKKPINGFNANAVQYIYESDFAHINGVFMKYKGKRKSNAIVEDFSTSIDADILSPPQLVKNHRNNTHEVVVQDINNTLYLISNSGKILWTKQLQGPILGKINQIDIYKNDRLQMVFATPNHIYVIDRNGNDVGPFPKKFNTQITQPLSVFDYDSRKNYRLLITQDKTLLMLDVNAKRIMGFNYNKAQNTISSQPKHFRIGSKDYIVFAQGSKLEILNRQGKERINVKSKIDFSSNSIFLYQNKFTTLDKNGILVQVDTKGSVYNKNIKLTSGTQLFTTSKTLVALNDNKLKIKDQIVDLDYGNYTNPQIFYLNDKIYISVTDLQSKKVFLFDSAGKPLQNFPVFGTAAIQIQNLDKKRGLELVTQADEKTILTYKIN